MEQTAPCRYHVYIGDILNDNGGGQDEIEMKYGVKTNLLENLQTRSAIPVKWRHHMIEYGRVPRVYRESIIIREGQAVPFKNVTSKFIYWQVILCRVPSAILKWREVYPKLVENGYLWGNNFKIHYIVERSTRLQAL